MAGVPRSDPSQALRYTCAPVETIDLDVTIYAMDQLEAGRGRVVHNQLSEPL